MPIGSGTEIPSSLAASKPASQKARCKRNADPPLCRDRTLPMSVSGSEMRPWAATRR